MAANGPWLGAVRAIKIIVGRKIKVNNFSLQLQKNDKTSRPYCPSASVRLSKAYKDFHTL